MKESCINHPPDEPILIVQSWAVERFEDHCVAAIVGYLQCIYAGLLDKKDYSLLDWKAIQDGIIRLYKRDTIIRGLNVLTDSGYLKSYRFTTAWVVEVLRAKALKSKGIGRLVCKWCNTSTVTLQEHHYPIPRSENGTETISICGSCHAEFHYLVDSEFFSPTIELVRLFDENPIPDSMIQQLKNNWARVDHKS